MSQINFQELRDALGNLDIEQWCTKFNGDDYEVVVKGSIEKGYGYCFYIPIAQEVTDKNTAKFIAAASPATIKALLDKLEAKDKRIAELEARTVFLPNPYPKGYGLAADKYNFALEECADAIRAAGIGVRGGVRWRLLPLFLNALAWRFVCYQE